ncbi:hypothetical protein D3C83_280010 [compost metagenome]
MNVGIHLVRGPAHHVVNPIAICLVGNFRLGLDNAEIVHNPIVVLMCVLNPRGHELPPVAHA